MVDRLKDILQKIQEWWNKFTAKQKTIIISVTAGVIMALAILATVLTRPQYETLITCESTKQASEIIELLEKARERAIRARVREFLAQHALRRIDTAVGSGH